MGTRSSEAPFGHVALPPVDAPVRLAGCSQMLNAATEERNGKQADGVRGVDMEVCFVYFCYHGSTKCYKNL